MRKFTLFLALIFFIGMQVVQAQTSTVTGTVTNAEDGSTIPGVSVVVKGTTFGTTTDLQGKFTLNVPPDAQSLIFSFVGMKTTERKIDGPAKTAYQNRSFDSRNSAFYHGSHCLY